jgi:hypothetical protein
MAMKINRGVVSAMLGVTLLAMPITASAHDYWRNRGAAPAYNSYRHALVPQANYAPRMAANDWRWRNGQAWRNGYRGGYAPAAAAPNCPIAAPYNAYSNNNYSQGYYPQPYNAAPSYYPQPYNAAPSYYPQAYNGALPNYGAAMPGGLANMIQRRDNAQVLYQQALRAGNRVRAKHLNNDVVALNKNIATTRNRGGYGRAGSFDQPYASSYGNGYGNSNLNALAGPLMRNFIP